MPALNPSRRFFRFAPSPNGPLHLGHAFSAILNHDLAKEAGGRFLLRIEDIDLTRCTPALEQAIYDDLGWLGLRWEEPVRRQSEHFDAYSKVLEDLIARGLVYPSFMTRGEVKARVAAFEADGGQWLRDPDGSPLYPDDDRHLSVAERRRRLIDGAPHAWRLDMQAALATVGAPLFWTETGRGSEERVAADPARWGDVVLSRSDAPSSYHLSVVIDDSLQGVTDVVRGMDLYEATSIHRLLQHIIGLPEPLYRHHRLVPDADGRKLSKSDGSTGLAQLRLDGATPADIRRLVDV